MGLSGKSLFRRRNRKSKKKLAESEALLDSLTVQLGETEKYEAHLHSRLSEENKRLLNTLGSKNSLLKRIKEADTRLHRVAQLKTETEAKLEEQIHRKQVALEVCRQLEAFHLELPLTVWNLQAQICRAYRLFQDAKHDIFTSSLKQQKCRDELTIKREELIRSNMKIKASKCRIFKDKSQIKKISQTKEIHDFHRKCMENLVVYVMKMNLRAAQSRMNMIERRGRHLKKMLEGVTSEVDMYICLTNELRKKQLQKRPVHGAHQSLRI